MPGDLAASLDTATPVRSPSGHADTLDETEARLAPLLERVPITRVYDATALDRLGVPVWAAVTPLAADLTVHAGKGTTAQSARVSAVMEAIERVSAESLEPAVTGSFARLRAGGLPVLDPLCFDPPFGFASESWVAGYDLIAGTPCLVARELVVSPGPHGPETNGLAAGNTLLEATLHAVLEVVERDAAALRHVTRWFSEDDDAVALRLIDPLTVPEGPAELVARLAAASLTVTIEDLTCDTGVPVLRTLLTDHAFPGREREATVFEGLGADLDPAHALTRALTEAAQAHTAAFVGARDTFEGETGPVPSGERFVRWLTTPSVVRPWPPAAATASPDLRDRLATVLGALRGAGFAHLPVLELTRPDLGVPVVRVLLAGASGLYPETARRPAARLLRALV